MPIDNIEKMRIFTFQGDKYIRVSLTSQNEETEEYTVKMKLRLHPDIPIGASFEIFLVEYYYPNWQDIGNNQSLNETILVKEEVSDSRISLIKRLDGKNEYYNVEITLPNFRRSYQQDNLGSILYAENRYYTLNIRLTKNYNSPIRLQQVYVDQENSTNNCSATQLQNHLILNPLEFTFSLKKLNTDIITPIN